MRFCDAKQQVEDAWVSARVAWKDSKAEAYQQKCIEPTRDALTKLEVISSNIEEVISSAEERIRRYE